MTRQVARTTSVDASNASDRSDCASAIAYDRIFRRVDHRGVVDGRKSATDQLKLIGTKQSRPDCFDLDVGKCLADAAVASGSEWNVAELLLTARSLHVQEPKMIYHIITLNEHNTSFNLL